MHGSVALWGYIVVVCCGGRFVVVGLMPTTVAFTIGSFDNKVGLVFFSVDFIELFILF